MGPPFLWVAQNPPPSSPIIILINNIGCFIPDGQYLINYFTLRC